MVDVSLHTGSTPVRARGDGGRKSHWLSFRADNGGEITIYGTAAQAEAFRMIADIFNDAFSKRDPERETFTAAQRAEFEASDIPF